MSAEETSGYKIIPLPAPWLEKDEYDRLNRWFYDTELHEYFDARLDLLVMHAADPNLRVDAMRRGVEYGNLKVGPSEPKAEESDELTRRHTAFVLTETATLLHHISETLLRFYFAHAPGSDGMLSPCPWLDIAGELSHVAFKRAMRTRFDGQPLTDDRRDALATVFYFGPGAMRDGADQADRVRASVEQIEIWLQHFADWFLEESNLFNSLKHGLAVQAGESAIRLGHEDKAIIEQDGPSLLYLERSGPERLWRTRTRWIDPELSMVEATFAIKLLRQIRLVARARYLREFGEPLELFDRTGLRDIQKAQLRESEDARLVLTNMSFGLGYLYAYEPGLKCSSCGREPDDNEPLGRWRAKYLPGEPVLPLCPVCVAAAA